MSQTIESLRFVRVITGFLRAGVFAQPALIERAVKIVEQINGAARSDAPAVLEQTAKVLKAAQSSILPSQAACSQSMAEIDALLAPMRQAQRSIEAASRELPAPGRDPEGAPSAQDALARPVARG